MEQHQITVTIAAGEFDAVQSIAHSNDLSVGQFLHDLLKHEIGKHNQRPRASLPNLAPLRTRLAVYLAQATGWDDLQSRLDRQSLVLREVCGRLALFDKAKGTRICSATELGFGRKRLTERFNTPFPMPVPS